MPVIFRLGLCMGLKDQYVALSIRIVKNIVHIGNLEYVHKPSALPIGTLGEFE